MERARGCLVPNFIKIGSVAAVIKHSDDILDFSIMRSFDALPALRFTVKLMEPFGC
jgi:hypothetical protein